MQSVLYFHTTRGCRGKMPSAATAMVLLLVACAGSVFGKVHVAVCTGHCVATSDLV